MDIINLKNVCKSFSQGNEKIEVLKNISLKVESSEIVALVGASGSGKSTLLHVAGLLSQVGSGSIYINGKDCTNISESNKASMRLQKLGFVYQSSNLLADFTALENVMVPLLINGSSKKEAAQMGSSILNKLGMLPRSGHYPSKLSGGEIQRVAIARSLANNPTVILADEPTGNLDKKNAQNVIDLFIKSSKTLNTAILLATHDEKIAAKCDRIITLKDGKIHE